MEKETFDFNFQNRVGLLGVFEGKGSFFSTMFFFFLVITITGLLVLPWQMDPRIILFRIIIICMIGYSIFFYSRAIYKMSFNEHEFKITAWKKDKCYAFNEVRKIKTTYYASWGIASIKIIGHKSNINYFLWTPSFDKERHNFFQNLQQCIKNRFEK